VREIKPITAGPDVLSPPVPATGDGAMRQEICRKIYPSASAAGFTGEVHNRRKKAGGACLEVPPAETLH
jgi:hypothetical protein